MPVAPAHNTQTAFITIYLKELLNYSNFVKGSRRNNASLFKTDIYFFMDSLAIVKEENPQKTKLFDKELNVTVIIIIITLIEISFIM